ncbi:tRNA pseudouridine(38-40) synthase TruA [bacterium]|nr:tRNA pseudouridine(38-40) synthase TruA [bacterium]
MWKYALLLSYRGTDFCGWQKQRGVAAEGLPSIQATIEAALKRITQEPVSVVGSGRTDSGVHALGQVAHFVLKGERHWECEILRRGLNAILSPQQIQVRAVIEAPMDFHAQRGAEKKQYSYYFQQGTAPLPHLEPFSWWIRKPLDVKAMQEGIAHLLGRHDFKPFQASGAKPGETVREILEAEVIQGPIGYPVYHDSVMEHENLGLVRVRIVGTGFLKQMVRGIAGTLLQVGEGRRPASDFAKILSTGKRALVGPTAPSRALWLERVWYPDLDWRKS